MGRITRAALGTVVVLGVLSMPSVSTALDISAPPEVVEVVTATRTAERGQRFSIPAPVQPKPAPEASATGDPVLDEVLELTNVERAKAGLAALTVDRRLMESAQLHSECQARRNLLTHDGPNGESPSDRMKATGYVVRHWAENAARGFGTSAEAVVAAWMRSPSHRANILRSTVTEIGLGIAYSADGTPFWTQNFASSWT